VAYYVERSLHRLVSEPSAKALAAWLLIAPSGFQQFIRSLPCLFRRGRPQIERYAHAYKCVIARALYPLLLYVAIEFRLYLHLVVPGVRGWIIVGTHHLVVRPFRKLKPFLTWYGIVYLRVPPFNPVRKLCLRVNLHA